MDALVIEDVKKAALRDIPETALGAQDVRVQVELVGLCGSDLNTFLGANPLVTLPRVPGHEVTGTIVEKGADVDAALAVGQRVIFWPYTACGACSSCRTGKSNACRFNKTLGVQQDGALRQRMVMPAANIIANDTLSPQQQALVEPISVGFHAVARGHVKAGDRVVVLGCGMIGIGAIMAAAARGAQVFAVDPMAAKRDTALAMGAHRFSTSTGAALLDDVYAATGDDGADVVIEAVGLPETFTGAIDLAAYGGRVVYVGYSKKPVSYETRFFNLKELDIYGSRNATRADFADVIRTLERMGDRVDGLVTKIFPLNEAHLALPYWLDNRSTVMKIMVSL